MLIIIHVGLCDWLHRIVSLIFRCFLFIDSWNNRLPSQLSIVRFWSTGSQNINFQNTNNSIESPRLPRQLNKQSKYWAINQFLLSLPFLKARATLPSFMDGIVWRRLSSWAICGAINLGLPRCFLKSNRGYLCWFYSVDKN